MDEKKHGSGCRTGPKLWSIKTSTTSYDSTDNPHSQHVRVDETNKELHQFKFKPMTVRYKRINSWEFQGKYTTFQREERRTPRGIFSDLMILF